MKLEFQDFDRMQYLLGKAKVQGLAGSEEEELRKYIAIEEPSAQNISIDDLIKLGLFLVGLYLLAKVLENE